MESSFLVLKVSVQIVLRVMNASCFLAAFIVKSLILLMILN